MRDEKNKLGLENLKVRESFEDLGVDGNVTLEWTLGTQCGRVWTGYIWRRIGISGGLL
jgi:hypothetical protein